MAKQGEILEYLAVNTTENSTTLWNYRQRECAFWTEYLPTVIGYITPTYPPTTEVHTSIAILFWIISMKLSYSKRVPFFFSFGGSPNRHCKLRSGR